MARKFIDFAFTPSVIAAQERYGTLELNTWLERDDDPRDTISATAAHFIEGRDGFYQATVGENGWPYVQFRGGPPGFLKVLDDRTIGYADFRGNIQYISVGNMDSTEKVSLILMDYPNRRRLKIWARAEIVEKDENPALIEKLTIPTYPAKVERAVLLHIEALDWNCPQHIPKRYTEKEIEAQTAPLKERIAALEAQIGSAANAGSKPEGSTAVYGVGPIALRVAAVRQLTPLIRAFELVSADGRDLPTPEPGAHLEVPVPGDGVIQETRPYSICNDPAIRGRYEIAVRLEEDGRGGSKAIYETFVPGTGLRVGTPRNTFPLHKDDRPTILVAGGIGITPLKAMAHGLKAEGRNYRLHYISRSAVHAAYLDELRDAFGSSVRFHHKDETPNFTLAEILTDIPERAVLYVCGPDRLMDAVAEQAPDFGITADRLRFERFSNQSPTSTAAPFEVHLARTGKTINVAADETILDALQTAGIDVPFSCRSGTCGTCAVKVLEGKPEHRDSVLTNSEHNKDGLMTICISRTPSDRLVLDL